MAKLVIKLKLLGDEDGDTARGNLHTCKICNKKFSCGKAYGGHKRIHTMKRKEKKPIEEINIQFCDARPRYTKCDFCPRTFRAQKSFEEHMKTHGWRACNVDNLQIPVPRNYLNSSSTPQSNDALEAEEADDQLNSGTGEKRQIFSDLVKVLPPSWGLTGRRGQNAKADLICVPSSIGMYHGADDLMVLSLGKLQAGMLPLKKRKMDSPPLQELHHQSSKTEIDSDQGKEKIPVLVENSGEASYHALGGGHNANYKKEAEGDFVERGPRGRPRHRCPNCNKSYTKSQALWAHRRHCERTITTTLADQVVALEEATVVAPKRTFSFDLNELPPPESEDEMDGK